MIEIMVMRTDHLSAQDLQKYRLGRDREEKILSMARVDDRKRSLGAGILLCMYLEAHGRKPDDVVYGEFGKPLVPGLHFSIAHSGRFAVLASSGMETGCDAQVKNGIRQSVLEREYTAEERRAVLDSSDPEKTFYEIWTAKEAYLKMKGTGIRGHLNMLDVSRHHIAADSGREVPVCFQHTCMEDTVITVCTPRYDELMIRAVTEAGM